MNREKDSANRKINMNDSGNYNESIGRDYVENNYNNCIINVSQTTQEKVLDKQQKFQTFELDCTQLENFLSKHEWQKADDETVRLMLKATNQEKRGYLDDEDIKKIPCANLDKIDGLWRTFSNQQFGFSVQYEIWQNLGGYPGQIYCSDETFEQYTTQVGWCIRDEQDYLLRSQIIYSIDAPKAHLPFWCYCWSGGLWGCSIVFSRVGICLTERIKDFKEI
jgi:hypothetical protein